MYKKFPSAPRLSHRLSFSKGTPFGFFVKICPFTVVLAFQPCCFHLHLCSPSVKELVIIIMDKGGETPIFAYFNAIYIRIETIGNCLGPVVFVLGREDV